MGEVRAPPGGLCEVTATKVPGERVWVSSLGDWGRHVPTVDDLLSPGRGRFSIYSPWGVTRVRAPAGVGRLRSWWRLSRDYETFARLRQESLGASELRDQQAWIKAARGLGYEIDFEPWREGPEEIVSLYRGDASSARAPAPSLAAAALALPEWAVVAADRSALSLNHLAAVGVTAMGLFFARLAQARAEIEQSRASLPLTIGGWGTRGKSGTERIKAALFQGLGCEVLVKTTGCEAMFIHAVPNVPASEVFIYRTYDKATIWEQRDLVNLAASFGVDVFLWECMALNPAYVELLEQRWMRDDFCTLTNTYPDHENIQGPAGIDIPRVMVNFLPRGKTAFTAEEQMLPILRDGAAKQQTDLVALQWEDHALLPQDLLARFPYEEHPRNIALVIKLAARLGVPFDLAIKEMADHVVPDLGVLKTYPEAVWRGRRLVFSNGMSANERTGFLNNWSRCGFDQQGPDDVGEWVVTVVNNRADRVSRSMVFADIVVGDASAHAQVFIGTNLEGLGGFVEASLQRFLGDLVLMHPDERRLPREEQEALAWSRALRALSRVKVGELGPFRLAQEASAIAGGLGVPEAARLAGASVFDAAIVNPEASAALLSPFCAALGTHGEDALRHLVKMVQTHASVLACRKALSQACSTDSVEARKSWEASFRSLYADLFRGTLVPLKDSSLSGDQIVDAIARAAPPGFRVRIMGIQNIKGTGLDFAYRWVHFDRTVRTLATIHRAEPEEALRLARELVESDVIGVLDCLRARDALARESEERRQRGEPEELCSALAVVSSRFGERLAAREASLAARKGPGESRWKQALEKMADVYDGVLRRRAADRTIRELVSGHISHDRAAIRMQELMRRQKGGWLFQS